MVYYGFLAVLYLFLGALLPASKATQQIYHLSGAEYHLLLFSVQLPLVLFWLPAFFGYIKLNEYASLIKKSPEGPPYQALARGLQWLAWGLAVPSIISLILNTIANSHPGFHAVSLIVGGYISLLFPLIAFNIISNGSHALAQRTKAIVQVNGAKSLLFIFAILGTIFCFATFRHIDLSHAGNSLNPYYLPTWLVVVSLVVPYLYAWFVGLLAAYQMLLLSRHTQGSLYRQAFQYMAAGLTLVIISLGVVECFRSVVPRSGHLSISAILIATYIFELISTGGFILISYGVTRLKKLEEV